MEVQVEHNATNVGVSVKWLAFLTSNKGTAPRNTWMGTCAAAATQAEVHIVPVGIHGTGRTSTLLS